jgi:hypothetical protein
MALLTAQKVNIVCPEGDVLLRGAEEGNKDLLLVSSRVLTRASDSFSKILHTPRVPKLGPFAFTNEVKLPEDDVDTLLIICNILHGRNRFVPDILPLEMLVKVARSCSRHQLSNALLAWSPKWLDHASSITGEKEIYIVLAVALDLGITPTRDKLISSRSNRPVSVAEENLTGITQLVPPCFSVRLTSSYIGGFHYQKTQIMLKAVAALRNCSLDMYYISPRCSEGHLAVWEAQLKSHGLLPFERAVQSCSLRSLMDALTAFEIPESVPECGCRGFTPGLPQKLRDAVSHALYTARMQ